MKKVLSLLLLASMLVGCGSATQDNDESTKGEETKVEETKQVPEYHYENDVITIDVSDIEITENLEESDVVFEVKNISDQTLYQYYFENRKKEERTVEPNGVFNVYQGLAEAEDGSIDVKCFVQLYSKYEGQSESDLVTSVIGSLEYDSKSNTLTEKFMDDKTSNLTTSTLYDEGGLTIVKNPSTGNSRTANLTFTNNTGHTLYVSNSTTSELLSPGSTINLDLNMYSDVVVYDFDNKDSIGKGCEEGIQLGVVYPNGTWYDPAYPYECIEYVLPEVTRFSLQK